MVTLESFKYYLIKKGIRQGTVVKHFNSLTHILSKTHSLDVVVVERFIFSLHQEGKSPGYLNVLIQSLRKYGDFTNDESYKQIKYFKVYETEKGVMSDDEITRFLAITAEDYQNYLRHTLRRGGGHIDRDTWELFRLFFRCLALSGLRPSELSTMRLQQCNIGSRLFHLTNQTKTSKPRTVPISDILIPYLEQHLKTLKNDNLFPNWSRDKWREQFNMRIKYLGIRRDKLTTYSLRHSWVSRLLDEGANPHVMAEMAGHSLEQQATYYHLTSKSKRVAMQKDTLGRKALSKNERALQGRKALEDSGFIVFESQEINGKYQFVCSDE